MAKSKRKKTVQSGGGCHDSVSSKTNAILVYTSNFEAFRKHCRNPSKFKVHRPKCTCPSIDSLILHNRELLSQECEKDSTNPVLESAQECFNEDLTDGLIVVPQLRSIAGVYFCLETTSEIFDSDPVRAEQKLHKEMLLFSGISRCKVTCAPCLLEKIPNAFACVSSTTRDTVDQVRDRARRQVENNTKRQTDHAHYIATLPLDALMQLHNSKTRSQTRKVKDELTQHLVNQGVPVEPENNDIAIQHHLGSLLWLVSSRAAKHKDDERHCHRKNDIKPYYWLVIIFDDTGRQNPRWSLDLPGGKRNLGENSLAAAIRETEEEASFVWDTQWLRQELRGKGGTDINTYYMLSPPDARDQL